MDVILKCFFEHFDGLDRDSLHARYKRRALVEYFNVLIEGCRFGEESTNIQNTIREAIIAIIRYHETSRRKNGGVCIMGKYHNILYVAAKLCYDWQLQDTATVATLLDHIYSCEKTFERLLVGALFGTRAPHFIAGWKSDFDSQEENVRAMVYFLDHATTAGLEYRFAGRVVRYVDVPIESCGRATCVKILLQLGVPDQLLILLRYGALPEGQHCYEVDETMCEIVLDKLSGCTKGYPYNLVACLQVLLRVLPRVDVSIGAGDVRSVVLEKYLRLVESGVLPVRRSGLAPVELKHLCRCAVRESLRKSYQLPAGIGSLPIPGELQRYIDIMED